jgi:hypothetical protein
LAFSVSSISERDAKSVISCWLSRPSGPSANDPSRTWCPVSVDAVAYPDRRALASAG